MERWTKESGWSSRVSSGGGGGVAASTAERTASLRRRSGGATCRAAQLALVPLLHSPIKFPSSGGDLVIMGVFLNRKASWSRSKRPGYCTSNLNSAQIFAFNISCRDEPGSWVGHPYKKYLNRMGRGGCENLLVLSIYFILFYFFVLNFFN